MSYAPRTTEAAVLKQLILQPRHPYQLWRDAEGSLPCSRATLYLTCERLERLSLVVREVRPTYWGPNQHLLKVTPRGKRLLSEWA